jgi:hypothetical protein
MRRVAPRPGGIERSPVLDGRGRGRKPLHRNQGEGPVRGIYSSSITLAMVATP